ncbi:MAG: Ribosome-binding ATPase YchF [candidate division BRC1 bacterium ADurb.BinA292]|nr:MAG: Ribosome-binding ATPase YchF [candidate division BRC1 bacterium ADurb.BinA292]
MIRGFADAAGQPPDVTGDLEAINLEMALSDLKKVENRLERMGKSLRGAAGREKELLEIEQAACVAVKGALEEGRPARAAALTPEQAKSLRGFQLLTMKPTMFLINEDEAGWAARKDSPVDLGPASAWPDTHGARLCGEMEMEIARLEEADRAAFMEDLGIREPAAHRVIRLCYELLGQISFFTVGPDECRAWTVRRGALAPEAAGAIHTDLERGFIRAEVIGWEELLALGSYAEAKKKGKLRLEGKQYEVRDGDVINVLFNV